MKTGSREQANIVTMPVLCSLLVSQEMVRSAHLSLANEINPRDQCQAQEWHESTDKGISFQLQEV